MNTRHIITKIVKISVSILRKNRQHYRTAEELAIITENHYTLVQESQTLMLVLAENKQNPDPG